MKPDRHSLPRITLVLGGARSGKSTFAEKLALARFDRPLYLATAEATDAEMAARIRAHRVRRGPRWACIEEPLDLAAALGQQPARDGVLVECLTTWASNVLIKEGAAKLRQRQRALLAALRKTRRPVVLVSNEVGLGIVPASDLGREFRDLAGWLNQAVARLSDEAVFLAAGLPLWLKRGAGTGSHHEGTKITKWNKRSGF